MLRTRVVIVGYYCSYQSCRKAVTLWQYGVNALARAAYRMVCKEQIEQQLLCPFSGEGRGFYGGRAKSQALEDQLERAAAGSWHIADRYLLHAEASCPCSSRLPFWSTLCRRAPADPPTVRFSQRVANMGWRTKERARDQPSVPGLLPLATRSTMLTEEHRCSRHLDAAFMQLLRCVTALPAGAVIQPGPQLSNFARRVPQASRAVCK